MGYNSHMLSSGFETYYLSPHKIGAPVCKQIEGLTLAGLARRAVSKEKLPMNVGFVTYGEDLSALRRAEAFYVQFDAPHNHTNWLVLNCGDVPELNGAITGISQRRRAHRIFYGSAKLRSWRSFDDDAVKELQQVPQLKDVDYETTTCRELLFQLLGLNHLLNEVGPTFWQNIDVYASEIKGFNSLL